MFTSLLEYPTDFYRLFFPKVCGACDIPLVKSEHHLCLDCATSLPFTNFENIKDNPVEKLFFGRVDIEFATSLLFFSQAEKVQNILHNIKYNDQKELAIHLGKIFGHRLQNNIHLKSVNTIIAVPLHPKKLHLRGYNQSELIAEGINEVLNLEMQKNNLRRTLNTATQTKKSRLERMGNVDSAFEIKYPERLQNKHVLLIDDVLTTGATLEACVQVLKENTNCKVSIVTIACAVQ